MTTCPCCGSALVGPVPLPGLLELDMKPTRRKVLAFLIEKFPRNVTLNEVIDRLYSDDANGGPENARLMVSVCMVELRKALAPYGWTIPKNSGGLRSVGRYRLEVAT